jgi:hypothetical protein
MHFVIIGFMYIVLRSNNDVLIYENLQLYNKCKVYELNSDGVTFYRG